MEIKEQDIECVRDLAAGNGAANAMARVRLSQEERIAALEAQLAELRASLTKVE